MRPSLMWGVSANSGLVASPLSIVVLAEEGDAKRQAADVSKELRVFARPVRVFVEQYPSLMWREATEQEKSETGAEFVIGK